MSEYPLALGSFNRRGWEYAVAVIASVGSSFLIESGVELQPISRVCFPGGTMGTVVRAVTREEYAAFERRVFDRDPPESDLALHWYEIAID